MPWVFARRLLAAESEAEVETLVDAYAEAHLEGAHQITAELVADWALQMVEEDRF